MQLLNEIITCLINLSCYKTCSVALIMDLLSAPLRPKKLSQYACFYFYFFIILVNE